MSLHEVCCCFSVVLFFPNSIWNSSHLATSKLVSTSKYYQESFIVILDVGALKYERSFRHWLLRSANGRKTGLGAFFLGCWLVGWLFLGGGFFCLVGCFFLLLFLNYMDFDSARKCHVNNFTCITAVW